MNDIGPNTRLYFQLGSLGAVFVSIVGGAIALVHAATAVTETKNEIITKIDRLDQKYDRRIEAVENKVLQLGGRLVGTTPEGYHRSDMQDWCSAAEKVNKGFVCPNPYDTPRFRLIWREGRKANRAGKSQ